MTVTDGSSQALVGKLGVFVGMDYVGKVEFIFNKTIPAGKIPAFGLEYSRTTYNKLWEEVQKHPEWKLTEEAWQEFSKNNNGQVPYYSDGDGSTTFRVPRLTGFPEGAGSLEEVGTVKEAGLPNIEGWWQNINGLEYPTTTSDGNLYKIQQVENAGYNGHSQTSIKSIRVNFNANGYNPIYGASDTVQPPSIVGMWVITAFVAVTGISSTALDNIVSGVTEAETRIGALEENSKDSNNVKIIYPNGGTAEKPAEIQNNSRYIEENPFKGYYVTCQVELLIDDKWTPIFSNFTIQEGDPNIYVGVSCGLFEGQIILRTAIHWLEISHPFNLNPNCPGRVSSAPCRVIVHKLGKIGE